MITVLPGRDVRARKAHQCCFCAAPIDVGEVHHRWACVEDVMVTLRAHRLCLSNAASVWQEDEGEFSTDEWEEFRAECEARWPNDPHPWRRTL